MKRTLCMLCCAVLLIAIGSQAAAKSYCWYEDKYGKHDYEQVNVSKATCTEDGSYILECRQCGKNVTQITEKATGHNWQNVGSQSIAPTCTESGMTTYVCEDCSQIRTQSVDALGHDWKDEGVIKAATCQAEGTASSRCRRCGTVETRSIPKAAHSYGAWFIAVEASDHSAGERARQCAVCGARQSEYFDPDGTLRRGARGEDVRALQQMLLDMGILNDVADGKFGAKTEAAVAAFQQNAGLYSDGVAWPQTIARLRGDMDALNATPEPTAEPTAEPTPEPTPEPTAEPTAEPTIEPTIEPLIESPCCLVVTGEDGSFRTLYCASHARTAQAVAALTAAVQDEALEIWAMEQTRALWQADLDALYDEWIAAAGEDAGTVSGARALFESHLALYETALIQRCGEKEAARQINALIEGQCRALCALLHGS